MIRKQQGITTPKVVPTETPATPEPEDWKRLPQPEQTITDFLKSHPIEELHTLPDDQLKALLAPYFPFARRAMLPTEKPSKIGVGARAAMEAIERNKDAIAALLASRKIT